MEEKSNNFLEEIIEQDLAQGKVSNIHTRFPPEPNGYLHIGHAASICLNFGLAKKYNGKCNLRFDDTNPVTEETEYVESIMEDVKWLGFKWDNLYYTSDYFPKLYEFAIKLIKKGLAYVDDSNPEEIAAQKGDIDRPGIKSSYRNRSIEENLQLFEDMKAGKYDDGAKVLRAKIDMSHPNLLMRDPIIYRIKRAHHHRTGDTWCIYPMYDFAHGQSDSIEGITHSICTLEFIHHRPLYDWLIDQLEIYPSHQYEFARRSVTYMITSKRRLLQLVQEGIVAGWDDPRMPTVSGLRRRGYTPASIRNFVDTIGIAKRENNVEIELLEHCVREDLNKTALRGMVVIDPIKLIINNYPKDSNELLQAENNPEDEGAGQHFMQFSKELWIERDDFMEQPPKKYFRLGPGLKVRLKHAYIVECTGFSKNESGMINEVYCDYFPNSKSGHDNSGIKVKGTIHWVDVNTAKNVTLRQYDKLFTVPNPMQGDKDFKSYINPDSLVTVTNAQAEPFVVESSKDKHFQFMRKGYYYLDPDSTPDNTIFNLTVSLKDSWSKAQKKP